MGNSIKTISSDEIASVVGAGETGREAGEALAKAVNASPLVVAAAGVIGSALEDAIADAVSPKEG